MPSPNTHTHTLAKQAMFSLLPHDCVTLETGAVSFAGREFLAGSAEQRDGEQKGARHLLASLEEYWQALVTKHSNHNIHRTLVFALHKSSMERNARKTEARHYSLSAALQGAELSLLWGLSSWYLRTSD